jgi:hypothetical protein
VASPSLVGAELPHEFPAFDLAFGNSQRLAQQSSCEFSSQPFMQYPVTRGLPSGGHESSGNFEKLRVARFQPTRELTFATLPCGDI